MWNDVNLGINVNLKAMKLFGIEAATYFALITQILPRVAAKNTADENEIYGLYNVNERIRLKFGQEYGISIKSVHMEGTQVRIKLPYVIEENGA